MLDERFADACQQVGLKRLDKKILIKLKACWALTKSRQTFLTHYRMGRLLFCGSYSNRRGNPIVLAG